MTRGWCARTLGRSLVVACALVCVPLAAAGAPTPDPAPEAQPKPAPASAHSTGSSGGSRPASSSTSRPSSGRSSSNGASFSAPTAKPAAKPVVKQKKPRNVVPNYAAQASATPKTTRRDVATPAVAVAAASARGNTGSRRILVPALPAVAAGAVLLALALRRTLRNRSPGARTTPRASRSTAYTDTTTAGWMTREEQWLLDGKHAYLAAADAAGVTAFERFLESHGVPFLVDRRGDAVVFSAQQR